MKIINKTNETQEFKIKDSHGREYTVFIKPGNISKVYEHQVTTSLLNLINSNKLIIKDNTPKINNNNKVIYMKEVKENPLKEETVVSTKLNNSVEVECACIKENKDEIYKCTVCGKEFASQRSLTYHINKIHSNNETNKEV
jgi:hypothetical protein